MFVLFLASVVWVGVHAGLAGTSLRGVIAQRLGDGGFRGVFSLLSVASIAALVGSYKAAPYLGLWVAPDWLRWLLVLAMLPAFLLLAASATPSNPTAVGGEARPPSEPRGVFRITRHPMLWSFSIWAIVHVLSNGDLASLLFFGAFAVTSLAGMPSIDAKLAARNPAGWAVLSAKTSILPWAAIASGRNRFVPGEIAWYIPAIGALAWALMLGAHPHVIGVAALPV